MLSGQQVESPGGVGLAAAYAAKCNIPINLITYTNEARINWLNTAYGIKDITPFLGDYGKTNAVKIRYIDIDSKYHMLRVDNDSLIVKPFKTEESKLVWRDKIEDTIINNNIVGVVILDYNKGLIEEDTYRYVSLLAAKYTIPIYVDSRKPDVSIFKEASLIKLNRKEYQNACKLYNVDSIESLCDELKTKILIVTLGAEGARLYDSLSKMTLEKKPDLIPGCPDVTGCGDVFDILFCNSYLLDGNSLENSLEHAVNNASVYAHEPIDRRLKCQN